MSLPFSIHVGDLIRVIKIRDPENWDPNLSHEAEYLNSVGKIFKVVYIYPHGEKEEDCSVELDNECEFFFDEIEVVFTI